MSSSILPQLLPQSEPKAPAATDVQAVSVSQPAVPEPPFIEKATDFTFDLSVALLIFIIGRWVARLVTRLIRRGMSRQQMEPTIVDFIANLLYGFFVVIVLLMAADKLGLPTTSLVAVIGASTLAVGMALRDSLANFAAGILLVALRYYRVKDMVEVAGASGTVESVQIFSSVLVSDENTRTIVPNGNILKAPIKNLTASPTRRLELTVKVAYDSDVPKVKGMLMNIVNAESWVLESPAPSVSLRSFGGGILEFAVRAWVKNENLWGVQTRLNEKIKKTLDDAGIVVK